MPMQSRSLNKLGDVWIPHNYDRNRVLEKDKDCGSMQLTWKDELLCQASKLERANW